MRKIDDPKNKAAIQQIMRDGMISEFWQLLCEVLDGNIEYIEKQIFGDEAQDWPQVEYKAHMQTLLNRRNDLVKLKNMPQKLSEDIEQPDQSEPRLDVYDTVEDIESPT